MAKRAAKELTKVDAVTRDRKRKPKAPAGRIIEIGYSDFITKLEYPNEPPFQTL